MTGERRIDREHRLFAVMLFNVALGWAGARAEEVRASAALFPDPVKACFAAGVPPKGRLSPLSSITSLVIRPRNPGTDGDGSFPPDVQAKLAPDAPDDIPLTLIVAFDKPETPATSNAPWGARFTCSPLAADKGRYVCGVANWCSDVGFELRIEGRDGLSIDVLPDAGPIGRLGNPCGSDRRALNGPSNVFITYVLHRQPTRICR